MAMLHRESLLGEKTPAGALNLSWSHALEKHAAGALQPGQVNTPGPVSPHVGCVN